MLDEIQWVRNQIWSCQHIFYYSIIFIVIFNELEILFLKRKCQLYLTFWESWAWNISGQHQESILSHNDYLIREPEFVDCHAWVVNIILHIRLRWECSTLPTYCFFQNCSIQKSLITLFSICNLTTILFLHLMLKLHT